ncbi:MAG TPA: lipoyl(octanoyl) transferase LipB [Candidatus Limnocylindria bacterium]|jgi:lipoyl(octanoyl) transferase|nr:lipoyl(octanoyl) transferase LipB [Candidatus Limnocylindria bacterium]
MSGGSPLRATWLGRVDYLGGWRLQEAVAMRVRAGDDERLLLLEHDPVYTIGRRGTTDHLLVGPGELRRVGASVYRVDRGGDITYHGPGQLVGYPIVRLGDAPDLVRYVRAIEGALVDALAAYGVVGRAERGKTGVWVDLPESGLPAKIAAIGVRVSRGVTTHGFALNVRTDLVAFERMLPCGFAHEVASLERLGVTAPIRDVAERAAAALADRLGRLLTWSDVEPARDDEIAADAPVRSAVDLTLEAVAV